MAEALLAASKALILFLEQGLDKKLDCERLARVGAVLLVRQGTPRDPLFIRLADYLVDSQLKDGGWVDVEETAWVLAYLEKMPATYRASLDKGLSWLALQKLAGGGWGRNGRDRSRVPYTSWVAILTPEAVCEQSLHWLVKECGREISQAPVLTYKLALPLSAFCKHRYFFEGRELAGELLSRLIADQNEDGGFGPWRGHPCGSDPWCTAVASLGLLCMPDFVPREVLERALQWLQANQLPNGLWPYHYIEEGTALAYWALLELMTYFKEIIS